MQPLQPVEAPEGLGLEALQLSRIQRETFPGQKAEGPRIRRSLGV